MASPGFGIPTIVGYGNGGSTNDAPPATMDMLTIGSFGAMHAPSLTVPPIMPILERITPRRMNATMIARNARAASVSRLVMATKRTTGRAVANVRGMAILVRDLARSRAPRSR